MQHGVGVEPRVQLAERHRTIAERRPQPHHRTPAHGRKAAVAHRSLGLRAALDIRNNHTLRAAVEHPAHPLPVMARHPHQGRDANPERGGADRRGGVDRVGRVLHVDIERVIAAGLGDHRDIDAARQAQIHAQHQLARRELLLHQVMGRVFGHRRPPVFPRSPSSRPSPRKRGEGLPNLLSSIPLPASGERVRVRGGPQSFLTRRRRRKRRARLRAAGSRSNSCRRLGSRRPGQTATRQTPDWGRADGP